MTSAKQPDAETTALWLEMFRKMVRIHRFERAALELYTASKLPGFMHISIGQEATAVGRCSALRPDDYMTSTHRRHRTQCFPETWEG